MPLPERSFAASTGQGRSVLATAVGVLTSPELEHIVDLVAWVDGPYVEVANARGRCRILRADPTAAHEVLAGVDPLARQDPLWLTPLAAELAEPRPAPDRNCYPLAGPRLVGAFDDPSRAPDLVVVHTDSHHWPERGGHLGEHGSLGLLQSRAPLVLSGAGVSARGVLAESVRTVDVGPTLAWLAGAPDESLADLDGRVLRHLVDRGADHVVGLLWDGTHPSDLLDLATSGELPAVRRLLDRGLVLAGGAIAEFPSVTLVNHTSALTGLSPSRHGIVNNAFWDRDTGRQVLANDHGTWHQACDLLRPGVRTLWELVEAARPGTSTACVNEPIDRGSSYSTMALIRATGQSDGARGLGSALPAAADDVHATQRWVAEYPDYSWSTQVDGLALTQMCELWAAASPPAVTWWNTTLTDSAHHAGGPFSDVARDSMRDTDRRLGVWLDLVEERGLLDSTTILLTADHGMVGADPGCTGDWDDALRAAGIGFRDEAYGFIYLGV